MGILVLCRFVLPNFTVAVYVHWPQDDQFARPHCRGQLQFNHRPDCGREILQRGRDRGIIHGTNLGRLTSRRLPPLQRFDEAQLRVHLGRHHLFLFRVCSPLEHAEQQRDLLVDVFPRPTRIDHRLPHGLELFQAEVCHRMSFVEPQ
jgi:hypothetical protein